MGRDMRNYKSIGTFSEKNQRATKAIEGKGKGWSFLKTQVLYSHLDNMLQCWDQDSAKMKKCVN